MNAFQTPRAPLAHPTPETQPAAASDAQPSLPAESSTDPATPEPAPQQKPHVTGEDMSGWASGGSD